MLLRRVSLCLPVLASLAMAAPSPASAQEPIPPCADREGGSVVLGTVSDRDTGEPVTEAILRVLPLGCGTLTDGEGRFRIDGLPAGEYELRIRHVGFGERTVSLDVPGDRTVDLAIRLPPEAIEVEEIRVEVERTVRVPYLEHRGFYHRMERDWGQFFDPLFFERNHVVDMRHLLSRVHGFQMVSGFIENRRAPGCGRRNPFGGRSEKSYPMVYLDGHPVGNVMTTKTLNSFVSPADIGAVEVYRSPSETAPDFIDSRARCGVIVIWTKRWLASDLTGP